MEIRNSADYMEFEETVKVRRRQIFPLDIIMRPVNTPLFPTGELVFVDRMNVLCAAKILQFLRITQVTRMDYSTARWNFSVIRSIPLI